MVSISSIFIGFLALLAAEIRHVRASKKPLRGHRALQAAGYTLIALGVVLTVLDGMAQASSGRAHPIFLAPAIIGGAFLAWTTFLEIPLGLKKRQTPPGNVYDEGSYAVCRHPGFWWFLLSSVSLALWVNNTSTFLTFSIANLMNLLLIFLQDKYTFPLQFVNYHEYAAKVPFLFPRVPHLRKQ